MPSSALGCASSRRGRGRSGGARGRSHGATSRPHSSRQCTRSSRNRRNRRTSSATPSQAVSNGHPTPVHSTLSPQSEGGQVAAVRDDDFLEQVIMAVDIKGKGEIGCAYYVAGEERLLCMEQVIGGATDVVDKLKLDLQPTTVILSLRSDAAADSADSRLRQNISLVDGDDDRQPLPYQIEIRPTPDFNYEDALNKLVGLCSFAENPATQFLVPGDSMVYDERLQPEELGLTKRRGKLMQISSWLNLDNKVSIGCAGAVISWLQRRRSAAYLPGDPDANQTFRVARLEMFNLRGTMLVNRDTLVSLQIIQPESHPNAFNQGPGASGAKESLSIYGLFQHHARTPQGKARLRQTCLRPSLDIELINTRLDFISVFVRPENQSVRDQLSKSLGRIKNMRNTVTLLHKGIDGGRAKQNAFKGSVWESLLGFCYHAIDIADTLREALGAEHLPLCVRAAESLDRHGLKRIGRMVNEIVDRESSIDQHRTVVNRGVDADLDQLKDVYDGMEDILNEKARDIQLTIPATLQIELNVTYLPHLGFHLTVPRDPATGQALYDGHELGWQLMFTTPAQAYYKDATMHEMDHELGDLYSAICDMEVEIAYALAQNVLRDEDLLTAASDICGELDCLLAFAHVAHQYHLSRPTMTEDNIIEIKGGRHLLQEMTVPSFVPNDTFLEGGNGETDPAGPSMILLTGPNYSGKSVYQKQVALAVYMAQMGSFLPADSATIGMTDKILTRITARETVSKVQSAFMIEMQQIAMALNSCTRRSLVVIDEFGKGTDTFDGAGLAAGVFHHLLSLGPQAPKTLVATHFHEIFELGLFHDAKNVAFAHMEVQVDERDSPCAGEDNSQVTYLFNLRSGRSNLSYGVQCAAMNGVPAEIVERAIVIAGLAQQGEDLVAVCSALREDEIEALRSAERASRMFLGEDFDRDWTEEELVSSLGAMLEIDTVTEETSISA
ncbi:uncharacterized protein PV07_01356 [Cladophialophora immunda]|uniref:DNA mismatch repair protein MSH5 n=1 Tax=Cladophialophora immunda TaxID=569365 RepID=A0A0D2A2S0_9EURO|nr:uncharacterized protein PV07_01356 [Cladophialophora immunda]KIW34581.1 hypothetical protein PV07_01356 [Cladophialophora immunda]OQV04523.1 Mut domain-containing protein [Cladophialophora immunda]